MQFSKKEIKEISSFMIEDFYGARNSKKELHGLIEKLIINVIDAHLQALCSMKPEELEKELMEGRKELDKLTLKRFVDVLEKKIE
jgi:hypothetical protein